MEEATWRPWPGSDPVSVLVNASPPLGVGAGKDNFAIILVRMCGPTFQTPTPFIYIGSENRDPFIYHLPFKINTYTYTSVVHGIASRKE